MTNANVASQPTPPVTPPTGSNVSAVAIPLTSDDIINELEVEIHRQYKGAGGLKAFTTHMGIDYVTYRRYIVKERKMPLPVLMDSFTALDIDPIVFFTRLRERVEGSDPTAD